METTSSFLPTCTNIKVSPLDTTSLTNMYKLQKNKNNHMRKNAQSNTLKSECDMYVDLVGNKPFIMVRQSSQTPEFKVNNPYILIFPFNSINSYSTSHSLHLSSIIK